MQNLQQSIRKVLEIFYPVLNMENSKIEDRVSLRKISSEDSEYFYLWASDPEVAQYMTWEAYNTFEDAKMFLVDVAEKHPWFMAICVDSVPVGSITLNLGKGTFSHKAELGYVLAKIYWGKGIATAAIKQAIEKGFQDLNLVRIEAFVDPDNMVSQRVLIKTGMTCEGLLKNHTLFKGVVRDRYLYAIINPTS